MRAVRSETGGVVTVNAPAPAGDGVRVRVTSAGICGSDQHLVARGFVPVVLGHEFGGLLDDGSLVAVEPMITCGTCAYCSRGDSHLCGDIVRNFYGSTLDGGLADEVIVHPRCIVPVPEGVPPDAVGLTEPLAVAVHAVNRARVQPEERALVIGGGTIGLLSAVVLRDRGVDVDITVRHPHQRSAAEALGIGTSPDGRYPVVVDAAGTQSSAEQAIRSAERGGRLVLVAVPWAPVAFDQWLVMKEVTVVPAILYGQHDGEREFATAVEILGRHPELPDALVTHRFGLQDATEAFRVAADRKAGAIKVHLLPQA